jgi:hypothetical protein
MILDLPPETQESIHKSTGRIIFLSIVLIILGIIAILMPVVATIISVSVFGWFFLFAGIVRIIRDYQRIKYTSDKNDNHSGEGESSCRRQLLSPTNMQDKCLHSTIRIAQ